MKYKVGDKVKVREDLKEGGGYKRFVNDFMETFAGEIVEIAEVNEEYSDYKITESSFDWTDDMFEGLVKLTKQEVVNEMQQFPSIQMNDGDGNKTYILKDHAVKLVHKLEELEDAKELALKQAVANGVIEVDGEKYLVAEPKPKQWAVYRVSPEGLMTYLKVLEMRPHYKEPVTIDTRLAAETLKFDNKEKAESIMRLIGYDDVVEIVTLDD